MARQYLGCPASSATIERLFSVVGIAFSDKRKSANKGVHARGHCLQQAQLALGSCDLPFAAARRSLASRCTLRAAAARLTPHTARPARAHAVTNVNNSRHRVNSNNSSHDEQLNNVSKSCEQ